MICPPEGLCCRVEFDPVRSRDGDTPVVTLRTGQAVAIRLIECYCAELDTEEGRAAKAFLDDILERDDGVLRAWFPPPRDRNKDGVLDIMEILQGATFDRIPGRLFIGSVDVSEEMVMHGYATKTKEG